MCNKNKNKIKKHRTGGLLHPAYEGSFQALKIIFKFVIVKNSTAKKINFKHSILHTIYCMWQTIEKLYQTIVGTFMPSRP